VLLQVLRHREGPDLLLAEYGGHQRVRGEELLVCRVLQILLLEIGPETFYALSPGYLLVLGSAHDSGQLLRQDQGLGESSRLLGGCSLLLLRLRCFALRAAFLSDRDSFLL